MDITDMTPSLHPEWLTTLFAHKSTTRAVFSDVLGIHELHHIALTYVSPQYSFITLSSTPSLDFNLFSSALWQLDQSYHPNWIKQCKHAPWQSLYTPERYDELYYIKQAKPRYPIGLSMVTKLYDGYMIYSLASRANSNETQLIFQTQQHELLQLGQYCTSSLLPLLLNDDVTPPSVSQPLITGA